MHDILHFVRVLVDVKRRRKFKVHFQRNSQIYNWTANSWNRERSGHLEPQLRLAIERRTTQRQRGRERKKKIKAALVILSKSNFTKIFLKKKKFLGYSELILIDEDEILNNFTFQI
ncbi:hypothetical protein T10_1460 [Trichinella papuae]|uniref:Uncharacterized protein n=1 Tax=Trichinella papuae TaxID=268474 RepID=A0A0V1MFN8_9BILA|nr:hypothetical protein T10_1460 [Trichinella papuae]